MTYGIIMSISTLKKYQKVTKNYLQKGLSTKQVKEKIIKGLKKLKEEKF